MARSLHSDTAPGLSPPNSKLNVIPFLPPTLSSPLTCPFCGLLCDDLTGTATGVAGGCARAETLFQVPATARPRVAGRPVDWPEARAAALALLAAARRPLLGGLACDVAGQRAALDLAERLNGVLDPMQGAALRRNLLAFQDGGWFTTTLSEVRNRADVFLFMGSGAEAFPRLLERLLAPASQFGPLTRRVIHLGPEAGNSLVADLHLPCPEEALGEVCAALCARLAGRPPARPVAGLAMEDLDALLDALSGARYGVLAWNAGALDFPQADLTVAAILDLVRALNRKSRWAGLPLGGNDGSASATQAMTWRTGYPLGVAFTAGGPHFDPFRHEQSRLLASGEADALVWISCFDPQAGPPPAPCPTLVLGRADLELAREPAVFLPVAVPGVQRSGMLHRMDGVVALPLAAPHPGELPGADQVLADLLADLLTGRESRSC